MKLFGLGLTLSTKRTRERELLDEMERVMPLAARVQVVEPCYPKAKTQYMSLGRPVSAGPCRSFGGTRSGAGIAAG